MNRAAKRVYSELPESGTPIPFSEVAKRVGSFSEETVRTYLLALRGNEQAEIAYGRGWYRLMPCAYCRRMTPLAERVGEGGWYWPGRGWVVCCLACGGYEQCGRCGETFDNAEGTYDGTCPDCSGLERTCGSCRLIILPAVDDPDEWFSPDESETERWSCGVNASGKHFPKELADG